MSDDYDNIYREVSARFKAAAVTRAKAYALAISAAAGVAFLCYLVSGLGGGWRLWLACLIWFGFGFLAIAESEVRKRR